MLTREDNEYLCKVGPGTSMGNLMRQYWIPAVISTELPERDGRPLRVRLLGEDLVAFRDSNGRVGLLANNCTHRGASLFFGRNEESGLRCVYHGWKYDVAGNCVDMPNEPAESNFKDKIHQGAYPCVERNGVVWTYMGPRLEPPPLPQLEWNMLPDNIPFMWRNYRACNWMQALEGDLDTSHINYLHKTLDQEIGSTTPGRQLPGRGGLISLARQDGSPRLEVVDTEFGVMYSAKRTVDEEREYHRIHPFLFPFHTMIGGGLDENQELVSFNGKAWVPMDDENTLVFEWQLRPGKPWTEEERVDVDYVRNPLGYLPSTTEPAGAWKLAANKTNDYYQDYELQRTKLFCGIISNPLQDAAMQETMGPIYERWNEHLGTTDGMIIRVRQRLIAAAKALDQQGMVPPGVDTPEVYWIRPIGAVLPKGADWVETTKARRSASYVPAAG